MKQDELIKGLKVLGIAYGKEFTSDECSTYYEFLQEYNYDTFKAAVKNIIKKSKFIPKISDLVDECENQRTQTRYEILDFMNMQGYFKSPIEYDKASKFLQMNIIPEWFKEDLKRYYSLMKQEKSEHQEQILIGGLNERMGGSN